jgi:hypothetical protein
MRICAKRIKGFLAKAVTGEQRFAGKISGLCPLDICFELTPANVCFAPKSRLGDVKLSAIFPGSGHSERSLL